MDEMELLEADCKTEPENNPEEVALLEERDEEVSVKCENFEENTLELDDKSETVQEPPIKRLKGTASKYKIN